MISTISNVGIYYLIYYDNTGPDKSRSGLLLILGITELKWFACAARNIAILMHIFPQRKDEEPPQGINHWVLKLSSIKALICHQQQHVYSLPCSSRFGVLVGGWIIGSLLVPLVPTFIIPPSWSLELLTSLVAYIFLFLGSTFLK